MCALEQSTIELPEASPQLDVPPEIPPETEGRSKTRVMVWVGVAALVAAVILMAVFLKVHKSAGSSMATATVERTQFVRTLRLKGTTEAVQSRTITAPMLASSQLLSLVITRLVPAGTKVKPGDLLVEFDRQVQIKDAIDKQGDFQKFASQVAENQAQEDATRAKDQTELKTAEDELNKDELEMRRNEILSRIDVEKNQENLDQAKANLAQLRQTFDLKRKSAKAAIRILELQRDKAQQDMLHAQGNANRMQIRSPIAGVVVLRSTWKQETLAQLQEGDQVHPGIPLMDVVDPSAMQVSVQANQQDIAEMHIGQAANVRLDAYPDIAFPSRLEALAPLGVGGNFSDKLHSFTANFSIQGNNPKLMPDLSAAVDLELEQHSNALVVPRESVVAEGKENYVMVDSRLGMRKQEVKTGPENDTQVVILSGLAAGDVLQRNPTAAQSAE